jgi:hypothetical protein
MIGVAPTAIFSDEKKAMLHFVVPQKDASMFKKDGRQPTSLE